MTSLEVILVGRTGFEPATPWSQTRYSTGLNYLPFISQRLKDLEINHLAKALAVVAVREGFEPSVEI